MLRRHPVGGTPERRSKSLFPRALRSVGIAAIVACALAFVGGGAVRAQDGAHQGYVDRVKPDVQIVVMPLPTGEWGISAVYPGKVAHADLQRRLTRLLGLTNWKANNVEFVDSSLDLQRQDGKKMNRASADREAPADPVMSEATFATPANVVDISGGTIDLSPFGAAFSDLDHVNVVFFIPATFQFRFRGLRHYADPHISLDMTSGQGTYTYVMNIKDHQMTSLALPRFQPSDGTLAVASSAMQSRARALQTMLVIALAGIVGCMVYLWATKLIGGNSSSTRG